MRWLIGMLLAALVLAAGCAGVPADRDWHQPRAPEQLAEFRMDAVENTPAYYLKLASVKSGGPVLLAVGLYRGRVHSWVRISDEYLIDPKHGDGPLRLEDARDYREWAAYEMRIRDTPGEE